MQIIPPRWVYRVRDAVGDLFEGGEVGADGVWVDAEGVEAGGAFGAACSVGPAAS